MADDGGGIAKSTVQVTFTHPTTLPISILVSKLTVPSVTLTLMLADDAAMPAMAFC